MGTEVTAKIRIGTKQSEATVLLETQEVIIRGETRMIIPLKEMKSLKVQAGSLSFSFEGKMISIFLGEKAEKWFEKIKNPKSVLDKLGVKPDSRVSIVNINDGKFLGEVKKKTTDVTVGKAAKDSDLIFYEANSAKEVEQLASLKKYLKPSGGIWVVSLKGKATTIKDIDVMKIGKKCGLVDNKVVGFSQTHTALKFVIPVAKR